MISRLAHRHSLMPRLAWALTVILLAIVALPTTTLRAAETEAEGSRNTRREAAMERGLLAVKEESWKLAARYFEEARKADAGSPEALRNLALATDRMGGRELLAIAWYRVFLATGPDAHTAAAVKQRILALEVKAEAKVLALLQTTEETTRMMTDADEKSERFRDIAKIQAELGDFESALLTVARCSDAEHRSDAFEAISDEQRDSGDLTGALESAEEITGTDDRARSLRDIAICYEESGNRERARYWLSRAVKFAKVDEEPNYPSSLLSSIARQQANIEDFDGAKQRPMK